MYVRTGSFVFIGQTSLPMEASVEATSALRNHVPALVYGEPIATTSTTTST
jgi:hypothetical protein